MPPIFTLPAIPAPPATTNAPLVVFVEAVVADKETLVIVFTPVPVCEIIPVPDKVKLVFTFSVIAFIVLVPVPD